MRKAILEKLIFLDRDGVINYEPGTYTWDPEKFQVLPGVMDTLKYWKNQGYGLVVITNQGGVARGLYSKNDVFAVHHYFQGLCNLQGFNIDAFYYCPHHENYSGRCLCRKPGHLMLDKALHHFGALPGDCVFIGDNERDMAAAAGAGVKGVLVETNIGLSAEIIHA
ncbi:MAG: HAD-IIIA family hydrolase [Bacteroidetes bacterium]|nr:HAD-IIIA family hydrolase [Bacteroidota bacterium]